MNTAANTVTLIDSTTGEVIEIADTTYMSAADIKGWVLRYRKGYAQRTGHKLTVKAG